MSDALRTTQARSLLLDAREVLAGLLFLGFGSAGLVIGGDYATGTAMRMGAGYFPWLVSLALCGLGVALLVRGLALPRERVALGELFQARVGLSIGGSVVAFALLLPSLGLGLSTLLMTLLSGLARRRANLAELTVLGCVLGLFSVLVFAYGLGLNLPAWPV
ncbi:tripartite tricarboxylate transporter TctB family protein [Pseudomonas sp. 5P_5.1_Bac1]|uniref:tripartite tricarboxylate transporter TctB family protein n=1 Tax=Pseudomonas sp. 5P_5.1_Bac1 TaxID=2971616 RepID=UPI0021C8DE64|nr:tripartite tricarboxylate transporter TctB family protein [Pseudomonas sp. 5P_5.1_Bac1]MCU1723828.1 tripartite tricarboxylate transporter TctB family protein [Pseudomonas sp. 5P_5.1_Bac1]